MENIGNQPHSLSEDEIRFAQQRRVIILDNALYPQTKQDAERQMQELVDWYKDSFLFDAERAANAAKRVLAAWIVDYSNEAAKMIKLSTYYDCQTEIEQEITLRNEHQIPDKA